jgi:hypothetical protein
MLLCVIVIQAFSLRRKLMFEKFTSADAEDFRQRYLGTFGFFRQGNKKVLVQLNKISTDRNQKVVEFKDKDGSSYLLYADSKDESIGFEFLPPKMEYHNGDDGRSYSLRRIPHRQYLRGICDRNTQIRTVYGNEVPVGFPALETLFTSTMTPKQAYEKVLKVKPGITERSFAISGQFAVSLDKGQILCLRAGIGAAAVNDGVLKIFLSDYPLWCTELNDACRRAGIPAEVK